MTCKEIHEQITAYVDNRVDEQGYREKLRKHMQECKDCRAAYERELLTKIVIRERAQQAETPESVRKAISDGIDAIASESAAEPATRRRKAGWLELFAEDFLSPVGIGIAAVLVIIGFMTLINTPESLDDASTVADGLVPQESSSSDSRPAGPENYFNKAADNFSAIVRGQLTLQFESSDPEEVRQFFADNGVTYTILFPETSAQLTGGVVSEHGATRYAHLLYTSGENTLLYLFEVPESSLSEGKTVYVTPDVLERLQQGEQIWQEPQAGQPLVMYEADDLVIAAVSNTSRPAMEEMMAFSGTPNP